MLKGLVARLRAIIESVIKIRIAILFSLILKNQYRVIQLLLSVNSVMLLIQAPN